MHLSPTGEDHETGSALHRLFASRPGAEHIASEFALAHLSCLLNAAKPHTVLEMGAGIGTLTYLLLTHPRRPELIVSVEDNEYCIDQFTYNLPIQLRAGHSLTTDVQTAREHASHFDVVIFDAENQAEEACEFLEANTIVFVEGSRKHQRAAIQSQLRDRNLTCNFNRYIPGHRLIAYSKTGKAPRIPCTNYRIWRRTKGCHTGIVEPLSPAASVIRQR